MNRSVGDAYRGQGIPQEKGHKKQVYSVSHRVYTSESDETGDLQYQNKGEENLDPVCLGENVRRYQGSAE